MLLQSDTLSFTGHDDEARAAYARALQLTRPVPEQRFLESRLAELSESARQGRNPGSTARFCGLWVDDGAWILGAPSGLSTVRGFSGAPRWAWLVAPVQAGTVGFTR